jgi:hypothetical protein
MKEKLSKWEKFRRKFLKQSGFIIKKNKELEE